MQMTIHHCRALTVMVHLCLVQGQGPLLCVLHLQQVPQICVVDRNTQHPEGMCPSVGDSELKRTVQ